MDEKKPLSKKIIAELRKLSPSELARRLKDFTAEQKEKAAAAARADPHLIELWMENGWLDDDGLPDLDNPHVRLTWTMADPEIIKSLTHKNRGPLEAALPEEQRAECMELYLSYVSPEDGTMYRDIENMNFYVTGLKEYRKMRKNSK